MRLATPSWAICAARLLFVQVDEDAAGRCDFARSTLTGDRAVRIAMAGPAAEYIYAHPHAGAFTLADCNASTDDLRDVDNYCATFLQEERQGVREQHWAATCDILVSRRATVQALAKAVVEQQWVHADLVVALFEMNAKDTA
jgi:hypothetical protein